MSSFTTFTFYQQESLKIELIKPSHPCFGTKPEPLYKSFYNLSKSIPIPDNLISCRSYSHLQPDAVGLPSPAYLKVIRTGAEENKFPDFYRQFLAEIETNDVSLEEVELLKIIFNDHSSNEMSLEELDRLNKDEQ